MNRWVVIVSTLVLAAAGCAGADDPPVSPSATQQPSATSPAPAAALTWSGPTVLGADSTPPLAATAVAGPGGLVAYREVPGAVDGGPTTTLLTSSDGEAWDPVLETAGLRIDGLVAGGPGYVAVGTQYLPPGAGDLNLAPWAAWSVDGATWQEAEVALPGTWLSGLIATGDGFVALGHSQEPGLLNILWTSADGKSWSPAPGDPFGGDVTVDRLVAGTGGYVAEGHRDATGGPGALVMWHSTDAVAWELAAGGASFEDAFGAGPLVAGVVPVGDGFVMVGSAWAGPPAAWTSTDGREWGAPARLPSLNDTSAEIHAVAASPDWVVAVGREVVTGDDLAPASQYPGLWASTDGVVWSQVPPEELRGTRTEEGISIDSVAWVGDHWLALGTVWSYPDEVTTAVAWEGR